MISMKVSLLSTTVVSSDNIRNCTTNRMMRLFVGGIDGGVAALPSMK